MYIEVTLRWYRTILGTLANLLIELQLIIMMNLAVHGSALLEKDFQSSTNYEKSSPAIRKRIGCSAPLPLSCSSELSASERCIQNLSNGTTTGNRFLRCPATAPTNLPLWFQLEGKSCEKVFANSHHRSTEQLEPLPSERVFSSFVKEISHEQPTFVCKDDLVKRETVCLSVPTTTVSSGGQPDEIPSMTVSTLAAFLASKSESIIIVDCRNFMSYNANHIVEAVNISCGDCITRKRLLAGKITLIDLVSGQEAKDFYRQRESCATVVVYDDNTTNFDGLQPTHPLKLLVNFLNKKGTSVAYLQGGLQAFHSSYHELCSAPTSPPSPPLLFSPTSQIVESEVDSAVISEILPYLYIGNERDAASRERLRENGITHVLNVTAQLPCYFESEGSVVYKRLPASDSGCQNLKQYFEEAIEFIESARRSNGRVMIHCLAGVSRSPTIAIAYLMARSKTSMTETFAFVKERRPIIAPNFNFLGQLLEFEQSFVRGELRSKLAPLDFVDCGK